MDITLLCNRDLASNHALHLLLPRLASSHRLRVFYSSRVGRKPVSDELAQLAFVEQALFHDIIFKAVAGSERGELAPTAELCASFGVPVIELNDANSEDGLAQLRDTAPDLFVSIRYGCILREQAIAVPRLGVLNLHSGLLPNYRGVMATFRAMLNRDEHIAATLHTIDDARIDEGRIIDVARIPVDYDRSYLWNVLQLYPSGTELVLRAVDDLARGRPLQSSPQPAGGAYYSHPGHRELAAFRARGLRLWDGHEVAEIAQRYLANEPAG